jgi:uncharacterized protein YebE (UPF0316 family)
MVLTAFELMTKVIIIENYLLRPDILNYVVIPFLIFLARIIDVSIGTLRVIYISKGYKFIAPVLGFFEVIIWLLAISQIVQNLSNFFCYLAYGAGFGTGTFVGMNLEEKVSLGHVIIRIITRRDASELVDYLKESGYSLTVIDAEGPKGPVKVIFMILHRHDINEVIDIVKRFNPRAFYSIEELRFAIEEEPALSRPKRKYRNIFGFYRKGK